MSPISNDNPLSISQFRPSELVYVHQSQRLEKEIHHCILRVIKNRETIDYITDNETHDEEIRQDMEEVEKDECPFSDNEDES